MAWADRVSREWVSAAGQLDPPVARPAAVGSSERRELDWPASAARVEGCLGRRDALRLLDWATADGLTMGRVHHQEEYCEWRVVRVGGLARGMEFTTELPEYWEVLAGVWPERALSLVAEFADLAEVPVGAVYGDLDALSPQTTAAQRTAAFRAQMLTGRDGGLPVSPLNNGQAAITCMVHRDNNVTALVRLTVAASRPYLVRDTLSGRPRFASGAEAIAALKLPAVDGRYSDPLIAETVVRLTCEGWRVQVDEPAAVYIAQVQHEALAQPDGADIPANWFEFSRPQLPAGDDASPRYQRLTLRLPADADFSLESLKLRRTGENLEYGGQIAELLQLRVAVSTSRASIVPAVDPAEPPWPLRDCSDIAASWAAFTREICEP